MSSVFKKGFPKYWKVPTEKCLKHNIFLYSKLSGFSELSEYKELFLELDDEDKKIEM